VRKELDRLELLRGGKKLFRGSPGVLKALVGVALAGFVAGLLCACCGVVGGWAEMSGEGDAELATWWTVVWVALGGLALIIPAVAAAVYYFVKKK